MALASLRLRPKREEPGGETTGMVANHRPRSTTREEVAAPVWEMVRSFLFVPADRPAMLAGAGSRGADALIVDLEDAVAPSRKEAARGATADWLTQTRNGAYECLVRINADAGGIEDLAALRGLDVDGLVIPKVSSVEHLDALASQVGTVFPGSPLIVLIETPGALRDVDRIAAHPNTHQLMMGEADLGADLGIAPDNAVWDSLRAEVVVASAAAGLISPIGPVDPDFSSPDRIEVTTRRLKDLGFGARAVIHPAQIEPVHQGLRPTPGEVEAARRLIADHNRALAAGQGIHLDQSGKMVDAAFIRRAQRVVATAGRYDAS